MAKLINDIRDDKNNVKLGSGDKKSFDDLENWYDISHKKVKQQSEIKRMKKV